MAMRHKCCTVRDFGCTIAECPIELFGDATKMLYCARLRVQSCRVFYIFAFTFIIITICIITPIATTTTTRLVAVNCFTRGAAARGYDRKSLWEGLWPLQNIINTIITTIISTTTTTTCLLYTSPSPRDATLSRMPSSA